MTTTTLRKPFIDFAAVKAAVTINQVLEHYGLMEGLKPAHNGDNLRGCCPIHKGSDPTQFSVSLSKNCWNCFSDCQGGGNVLDFVARMEDVDVREAAIRINGWFDLGLDEKPKNGRTRGATKHPPKAQAEAEIEADDEDEEAEAPETETETDPEESGDDSATEEPVEPAANKPLGFELKNLETKHSYFQERGVTAEAVEHFGLGFCKRGTLAGRIAIPIHDLGGHLVGYAGRWPGQPPEERPKYKLPKGFRKSAEVFNLHRAAEQPNDRPLILVEGFFDCIRLWQAGIEWCASLMGSSLSPAQEKLICETVPKGGYIELLFDEDDAGRKGREEAARRLASHAYVRIIPLPREGMQPDRLDEEELLQVFE
jgi:DNA primase